MKRTFLLENEINEPDPEVVALNAEIVVFDEVLGACLIEVMQRYDYHHFLAQDTRVILTRDYSFVLTGLSSLLDTLLLTTSSTIPAMNAHGCARLQLNILVLQQNLKNVEPNAQLSRSSTYYDLFTVGAEEIVKRAKEQGKRMGFSSEEVGRLLKLVYSEGLGSARREVSVAAERGLARDELLLSEYLW